MRRLLILVAAVCGAFWSASAQAQSVTTSTSTMNCSESACSSTANRALAPFDPSLGELQAIILQVSGSSTTYFRGYPTDSDLPASADFTVSGPMQVSVNGVTYQLPVGPSEQDIPISFAHSVYPVTVSGSESYNIPSSLWASFIGTENNCDPNWSHAVGICVFANFDGPQATTTNNVTVGSPDLGWQADYTLTYYYGPFGSSVPEPATWAMMLLGFGAIGFATRRLTFARNAHVIGQVAKT